MMCTGVLLFRCSEANTRRQSCGRDTRGEPSERLSSGSDGKFANPIPDRLDASGAGMADALKKVRRRRAGTLLVQVPMIADRHGVAVIEALHMADDLGQDAAEAVADGDDASAIKLRWLDVQQVIDASIGERALENVECGQFASFFDTQAALNEQFEQAPNPRTYRPRRTRGSRVIVSIFGAAAAAFHR